MHINHETQVRSLGSMFAKQVKRDLIALYGPIDGPTLLRKIDTDNASETDESVCHSHDRLDANVSMLDAFAAQTGSTADVMCDLLMLGDHKEWTTEERNTSAELNRVWNDAWNYAKQTGFVKLAE